MARNKDKKHRGEMQLFVLLRELFLDPVISSTKTCENPKNGGLDKDRSDSFSTL